MITTFLVPFEIIARWKKLLLTLSISFLFVAAFAGETSGQLKIRGKVFHAEKPLKGATVNLYQGHNLVKQLESGERGGFKAKLNLNDVYYVVIYKDNHVSKVFQINTDVPKSAIGNDFVFDCEIDLFETGNTPVYASFDSPIGKVRYASNAFRYDLYYTQKATEVLKETIKERQEMDIKRMEVHPESQAHQVGANRF